MKTQNFLAAGLIFGIILISGCVQEQETPTTTIPAPIGLGDSRGKQTTSSNMFLNVSGIEGESTDERHEDWIDVFSFSHGLSQPVGGSRSSGQSAKRSDFTVVKAVDRSSPRLKDYVSSGEHIDEITFEVYQTEGGKQTYLEYRLEDVIIASVRPAGSSPKGLPLEEVTFNYAKITWTYTNMSAGPGQTTGEGIPATWNISENIGV